MRKLALTLALAFGIGAVALPAYAEGGCSGWKNQSVQAPTDGLPKTTAQTPVPAADKDGKG